MIFSKISVFFENLGQKLAFLLNMDKNKVFFTYLAKFQLISYIRLVVVVVDKPIIIIIIALHSDELH